MAVYEANLLETPQVDRLFAAAFDNKSETLPINHNTSFKCYAGQGELYVLPHNASEARIFVNGFELDLRANMASNFPFKVDISHYSRNGRNTVQVSGLDGPEASVRVQVPWPVILDESPLFEQLELDVKKLEIIDTILQHDISRGFPGAQLCVVKSGCMIKSESYGFKQRFSSDGVELDKSALDPVDEKTLFDLASITKMFASNIALQKLVYEGVLSVEDKVSDYLPTFGDPENASIVGKKELTIRQLLEHQAGFQPDTQFFDDSFGDYGYDEAGVNSLFSRDKETTYQRVCSELPLSYKPGTDTQYSDTDYMIVGFIVEAVTGKPLDEYVEKQIYDPLGLDRLVFNPLKKGFSADDVAATELDGNGFSGSVHFSNMRKGVLRGEVHDPKSWYSMGGVSGHAGLFGTAEQLAVLAQLMLNGGGYGSVTLFDRNTTDQFLKPAASNPTFCLGWRREADNGYSSFFSNRVSPSAFGHTGWTGTLVVADPEADLIVVYLTNKLNTPIIDSSRPLFGGARYLSGQLGMPPFFVCSAMDGAACNRVSLFCEMIRHKMRMVAESGEDTIADRNALLSIADTLRFLLATCGERDKQEATRVLEDMETILSADPL